MDLVADANIVFSLFKRDSFTRMLMQEYGVRLNSPDCLNVELDRYADTICSKAKLDRESYPDVKEAVVSLIDVRDPSQESLDKAKQLIRHESDIPYLALALELDIPIWSNDRHFKQQTSVKVFTTEELVEFLNTV
ncbi:MAG: PIN domain-containing protein [Candidatus Altiarchaeota archaeon]